MIDHTLREQLVAAARQARQKAYAPYSGFKVGAAVLTTAGEIFTGCNLENASFGASICAERVAIFTALAAGARRLTALAVIAETPQPVVSCGLCLQVLSEFGRDSQLILANIKGDVQLTTLDQLLPQVFEFPKPIPATEKR